VIAGLSLSDVERISREGSPVLLQALGRLYGLGPAERAALGQNGSGGVPAWAWVAIGLAAGFVAGARVQKRWPDKLPPIVRGGEK
jgi:hypothetical protein